MRSSRFVLLLSGLAIVGITVMSRGEVIDDDTPVPPVGAEGGPSRVLDPDELEQWKRGRKVFDRDWEQSAGLGTPDFNGDSCRGCHFDPVIGGAGGLDVNVFRFGKDNGGGTFEDLPGGQVGSKLRRTDAPGRENHPVEADVFEQRQTPTAFGIGLIDSIPDSEILLNQDLADGDGDGIFGYARMIDVGGGMMEVGKFGWKGQVPTVSDFIRDAMGGELGLTVLPDGRGFGIENDNDGVGEPELSDPDFQDILFYLQNLAAPPRGGSTDPRVAEGEQIFADIGCATCHIPSLPGSGGPVPLYSNLLLHNIHPTTFRGMGEDGAAVGFYRTPPLWGLRRTAPYLHDGRAETVVDAILMHDGEATQVRLEYEMLPAGEKEALEAFLLDL